MHEQSKDGDKISLRVSSTRNAKIVSGRRRSRFTAWLQLRIRGVENAGHENAVLRDGTNSAYIMFEV